MTVHICAFTEFKISNIMGDSQDTKSAYSLNSYCYVAFAKKIFNCFWYYLLVRFVFLSVQVTKANTVYRKLYTLL